MSVLEVGRVRRAVGVRGEVVVRFLSDHPARRAVGTVLVTVAGERVIEACKLRPDGDWTVRFETVVDRPGAEALRGLLTAEAVDDPAELWVHQLLGARVVDQDGVDRGQVVEIHESTASDLLLLDDGHVVPITFVVGTEPAGADGGPGIIRVDTPDGLFDL